LLVRAAERREYCSEVVYFSSDVPLERAACRSACSWTHTHGRGGNDVCGDAFVGCACCSVEIAHEITHDARLEFIALVHCHSRLLVRSRVFMNVPRGAGLACQVVVVLPDVSRA
jgi:hypothetical protein